MDVILSLAEPVPRGLGEGTGAAGGPGLATPVGPAGRVQLLCPEPVDRAEVARSEQDHSGIEFGAVLAALLAPAAVVPRDLAAVSPPDPAVVVPSDAAAVALPDPAVLVPPDPAAVPSALPALAWPARQESPGGNGASLPVPVRPAVEALEPCPRPGEGPPPAVVGARAAATGADLAGQPGEFVLALRVTRYTPVAAEGFTPPAPTGTPGVTRRAPAGAPGVTPPGPADAGAIPARAQGSGDVPPPGPALAPEGCQRAGADPAQAAGGAPIHRRTGGSSGPVLPCPATGADAAEGRFPAAGPGEGIPAGTSGPPDGDTPDGSRVRGDGSAGGGPSRARGMREPGVTASTNPGGAAEGTPPDPAAHSRSESWPAGPVAGPHGPHGRPEGEAGVLPRPAGSEPVPGTERSGQEWRGHRPSEVEVEVDGGPLGFLTVRVSERHGTVAARFLVEDSTASWLLHRSMPELEHRLQQVGLAPGQLEIWLGGAGARGQHAGRRHGPDPGSRPDPGRVAGPAGGTGRLSAVGVETDPVAPARWAAGRAVGLDVWV